LRIHNNELAKAARAALAPLGCFQKGNSRIWLDDRGWWVGVTRFHLGSHPRHSSFETGVCWLWREPLRYSIHNGLYIDDADSSSSVEHFNEEVRLASRAAHEVLRLRAYFRGVRAAADVVRLKVNPTLWDDYDTAISSGLVRKPDLARRRFRSIAGATTSEALDFQVKARQLEPLLDNARAFKQAVWQRIAKGRESLGLPTLGAAPKLDA